MTRSLVQREIVSRRKRSRICKWFPSRPFLLGPSWKINIFVFIFRNIRDTSGFILGLHIILFKATNPIPLYQNDSPMKDSSNYSLPVVLLYFNNMTATFHSPCSRIAIHPGSNRNIQLTVVEIFSVPEMIWCTCQETMKETTDIHC